MIGPHPPVAKPELGNNQLADSSQAIEQMRKEFLSFVDAYSLNWLIGQKALLLLLLIRKQKLVS